MRTIELKQFGITVTIDGGSGSIVSTLQEVCEQCDKLDCRCETAPAYSPEGEAELRRQLYNATMDGIEGLQSRRRSETSIQIRGGKSNLSR